MKSQRIGTNGASQKTGTPMPSRETGDGNQVGPGKGPKEKEKERKEKGRKEKEKEKEKERRRAARQEKVPKERERGPNSAAAGTAEDRIMRPIARKRAKGSRKEPIIWKRAGTCIATQEPKLYANCLT